MAMKITSTDNVAIKARSGEERKDPATMKRHPVRPMSARAVALLAAAIDKGFVGVVIIKLLSGCGDGLRLCWHALNQLVAEHHAGMGLVGVPFQLEDADLVAARAEGGA